MMRLRPEKLSRLGPDYCTMTRGRIHVKGVSIMRETQVESS
jgi:hypothetical protein